MKPKYWLYGILALAVIGVIVISGCVQQPKQEVTCNPPYIKVGTECCLDENSNNICDRDETPTQPQTYCGDGICQSNEDSSSCPNDCKPSPSKTIGIRAFDYDKNQKKITVFSIDDPNYYPDWTLIAKGYGSDGSVKFEKEVQMDCSGFSTNYYCVRGCTSCYTSEEIPYLAGGTLSIKAISGDGTTQAVEDYSYSKFDDEPSFSISYDHFDSIEEEVVYKLTNTGKRIIPYGITHYLFYGENCGSTSMGGGWFIMIMLDLDKKGDGIVSPGETVEARGSSHYDLQSGNTYCSKLIYGFRDEKSKEIVFTVE